MKTIGIIGAMDEEISLLKSKMELVSAKNIVGVDFYFGRLGAKTVVLVRSGIGKVNAAVCAQVLVDLYAVDAIINIGVAGACDSLLRIGDVVISSDLVQHDFDTTAFGEEPGEIPRLGVRFFEAGQSLLTAARQVAAERTAQGAVHFGRVASGDRFISDNETKAEIRRLFKPLCVEMEGAAIAQCCYLNKLPFIAIRAISDTADGSAEADFNEFVQLAAESSASLALGILDKI